MFSLFFLSTALAHAQALSDRVLVVYNASVSESKQVASYYMAKRAIPQRNLCKIDDRSIEGIPQEEFESLIKQPIRKCLEQLGRDKILYIVFSYQTPYGVNIGPEHYALDQFIADIWDEYLPDRPANQDNIQPYFGAAESEGGLYQSYVSLADYRAQPNARRIYSVWRLDAPSVALAKGLIDKGLQAEAKGLDGNVCIDGRMDPGPSLPDTGYNSGDWEVHEAAEFARRAGFPVIEDIHSEEFGTPPAALRCDHAALYTGWYSLNHYNDAFTWNTGAIGIHLDSASVLDPRGGINWGANAVAHGLTVTAGALAEPYLDNLPHPDQAFYYLFQGANVGDALLRSERLLKWRILNIGDPLYRPFMGAANLALRVSPPLVLGLLPRMATGDSSIVGLIGINQAAVQGPITVSVTSDRPDLASVPQTVTIPQGAFFVKFPIATHHVAANGTVSIHVQSGQLTRSNTLLLFPSPPHSPQPAPLPKPPS